MRNGWLMYPVELMPIASRKKTAKTGKNWPIDPFLVSALALVACGVFADLHCKDI